MCLREYLAIEANRQFFEAFVVRKFGYGQWNAPYWFVGPEEGGGANCAELASRFQQWNLWNPGISNFTELEHLRDYCHAVGVVEFHKERPKRQATWGNLLSLLGHPASENSPPDWISQESLGRWRERNIGWKPGFQRDYLAQRAGPVGHEIALIEVSPLPSANMNAWPWGCLVDSPIQNAWCYGKRETFLDCPVENQTTRIRSRLNAIRDKIDAHKPSLVIFYGQHSAPVMKQSFGVPQPIPTDPIQYARINDCTHCFWIRHPNYWRRIGGGRYRIKIQDAMKEHHFEPWREQ